VRQTPREKRARRRRVGAARMLVADISGEGFKEALARLVIGRRDEEQATVGAATRGTRGGSSVHHFVPIDAVSSFFQLLSELRLPMLLVERDIDHAVEV